VLILCARQTRALLPTIASRCLHVRFRPLGADFIASALVESRQVSKPTARLLAATAQGSLGRALSFLEAPMDAPGKERPGEGEFQQLRAAAVELFVRPKTAAILGPLRRARIERDRGRFLSVLSLALYYYRDALRWKVCGENAPLAHEDMRREIAADAGALPIDSLVRRVRILEEIGSAVQSNVTVAYAVASAQHRMGLGPNEASSGGPARAGIRHG
jgi:hypothetical protein